MNQSKQVSPARQLIPSRSISQLTYSTNSAQHMRQDKEASQNQINQLWDHHQVNRDFDLPDNPNIHEAVSLIKKLKVNQALEILNKDVIHGRQYLGALSQFQQVSSIVNILTSYAMSLLEEQSSSSLLLLLGCDFLIKGLVPKQQAALRVQVLNGLGCYYRRTDQMAKALMELEQALHEIKLHRLKDVAITHLNLSVVLSTVEEHEGALENAKKAVIESHKVMQTYVAQKLLKTSQRFQKCVSILSISFYNVGVQEHFYQRYQLALQAYASSFKIAEDNLGVEHVLTLQLRAVYEQFARELALAEAQKLSLQSLKSTKIIFSSNIQNQKLMRPQTATSKGSYMTYLGISNKPKQGGRPPLPQQKLDESQINNSQLTFNDVKGKAMIRPQSAMTTKSPLQFNKGQSDVITENKNKSFSISKAKTSTKIRMNNYFNTDREAINSSNLVESQKSLKDELQELQAKAQEERLMLQKLKEQRIKEQAMASEIGSKTVVSSSGKKFNVKKTSRTDPSFQEYYSEQSLQKDKIQDKSLKQNKQKIKAAIIIQASWRSQQIKLERSIKKMAQNKQILVQRDYVLLPSSQKSQHDGYIWGWFNYRSCTFQLVFVDLYVLRKSKKPQRRLDKIVIDSAKLIHKFTLYIKLDRLLLLDMFAQNNDNKQLINNKKLDDFLGIIYRKLKSKLKLIQVSQQLTLRADINDFVMLFYQEKLKVQISQKLNICFIKINYKIRNQQLLILQNKNAQQIQRFWKSKYKPLIVQESIIQPTEDIIMEEQIMEEQIIQEQIIKEQINQEQIIKAPNLQKIISTSDDYEKEENIVKIQRCVRCWLMRLRTQKECQINSEYMIIWKLKTSQLLFICTKKDEQIYLYVCNLNKSLNKTYLQGSLVINQQQFKTLSSSENPQTYLHIDENNKQINWLVKDQNVILLQKFIRSWLTYKRLKTQKTIKVLGIFNVEMHRIIVTLINYLKEKKYILDVYDINQKQLERIHIRKELDQSKLDIILNTTSLDMIIKFDDYYQDFQIQKVCALPQIILIQSERINKCDKLLLDYENYESSFQKNFVELGTISGFKEKERISIQLLYDDTHQYLQAIYEPNSPFIFKVRNFPKVLKKYENMLKAFIFVDHHNIETLRVYSYEHEKAAIYLQRYFNLIHYQRKFKVKIPKQQKSGDLYVGRRIKTNAIYMAVTTIDEEKRKFYKFPNENYRQFIEKIQFRIMGNLKYSKEDGIYLLQEPEHQIVAQNFKAQIYAYNGPGQKRFEFQGIGLLNAIYDIILKKIIIASDDRKVEAVQVDIPVNYKLKDQVTAYAEGLLNKSFIIINNLEKCVIYYDQKDQDSVLKIQQKIKQDFILRSFKMAYNYIENGSMHKKLNTITLIQNNFFTLHIRISNNNDGKFTEFTLGRLDKIKRNTLVKNFTRFCGSFSQFNSKSHSLEINISLMIQNLPSTFELIQIDKIIEQLNQNHTVNSELGDLREIQETDGQDVKDKINIPKDIFLLSNDSPHQFVDLTKLNLIQ